MSVDTAVMKMFKLPEDWEVIGTGRNRYQPDLENEYFVLDVYSDIITVLIYSTEINTKAMTEYASWGHVRRVKINKHDAHIYSHPEGYRKSLTWFCPESNKTFLIMFSKNQSELVQVLRKTKCH
jgi:hypothetical protein